MDLKDIQALHAQYTTQPVMIDIASHAAAMPALPSPEQGATTGARIGNLIGGLRKATKPTLIALAIAAVAAASGMSIARIWHVMHEAVSTPAPVSAPVATKHAAAPASEPTGEQPVDFNPPRPLTSSDFDLGKTGPHSALSSVDARTLSTMAPAPTANHETSAARPAEQNVAAASPIRAQLAAPPSSPPVAAPVTAPAAPTPAPPAAAAAAPVAPVASITPAAPVTATAQTAPSQPKTAATAAAQETAKTDARPVLRPLHHITRHPTAPTGNASSPEAATPPQTKAQPGKTGDVQLF
ncbi:hypothetical protein P3T18_001068 [Paraburkholderia sp. GAS199]|uniref:hypothetical protein n=1 Tax=Paraburkholderia sp. GAS199 TaxID=3035126 RepID=UPI003D1D47D7